MYHNTLSVSYAPTQKGIGMYEWRTSTTIIKSYDDEYGEPKKLRTEKDFTKACRLLYDKRYKKIEVLLLF